MKKVVMLLTNAFMPDPRPYNEALSLVKAGYRVKILCWDRETIKPQREIIDGIEIQRIHLRSYYGRGTGQIIFLLMFWLKVSRYLLKEDVDVIHCHDLDTLPAGLLVKIIKKVKIVFDSHDIYSKIHGKNITGLVIWFIGYLEKKLIKKAQLVIVACEEVARFYESYGVKNIIVVSNFKNLEKFRVAPAQVESEKKRLGIKDQLVISYIASLGHDRAIEPLLELTKEDAGLFLVIGGEGPQKQAVERAARGFPNIKYLGFVPPETAPLYTAIADIIYYGIPADAKNAPFYAPNKLFEAMAGGKAFLGLDAGFMARITKQEKSGILIDQFTKDKIKEAVSIFRNKEKLKIMQENARAAGLRQYNWPSAEKVLLAGYAQLW